MPEVTQRMRSEDAAFLYLERKEVPLTIGSVNILDGKLPGNYAKWVEACLPELPRYRQRVVFSPLNFTHPSWEYDPEFDIRNHVHRVRLDPPGNEQQLSELSGKLFTPLMDRGKPLWDITVVDGLEGGRSALISRLHHCMVDGVAGTGLMSILCETSPSTRRPIHKATPQASPLPGSIQLLIDGLATGWMETLDGVLKTQRKFLDLTEGLMKDTAVKDLRTLAGLSPELLLPVDPLPFNKQCSGVRRHCWAEFSFDEMRAIRAAAGGTLNDIALMMVAGAVSRYARAHNQDVKGRFVRVMVPVNLRTELAKGQTGNQVSAIPISIPLDIQNPLELLKAVTIRSSAMKSTHAADLLALLASWAGLAPPPLQWALQTVPFLWSANPMFNIVCTNVPGPSFPLYVMGRKVLTYYPQVPVGAGLGLGVAIESYNQKLYFGVTSDALAAPDGDFFRDLLVESYQELRKAAGVNVAEQAAMAG
jgi:diacylglycerol O-acyltransferase